MAGATGDRHAGALNLGNVVGIDLVGHGVHEARDRLHRLGIISKVETRTSVRANGIKVFGVAGIATDTKRMCPLLHDVVDLFPCQILGQHLHVSGLGKRAG